MGQVAQAPLPSSLCRINLVLTGPGAPTPGPKLPSFSPRPAQGGLDENCKQNQVPADVPGPIRELRGRW